MSLFHVGATLSAQADAKTALEQITQWFTQQKITATLEEAIRKRTVTFSSIHNIYVADVADVAALLVGSGGDFITSHYALSILNKHIEQETLILSKQSLTTALSAMCSRARVCWRRSHRG